MDILLTTKEVAALLNVSARVATSFLAKHGIRAVDFGRGRGAGSRWVREQIEELIQRLTSPPETAIRKTRKKVQTQPARHPPLDPRSLSNDDLYRMVQQQQKR